VTGPPSPPLPTLATPKATPSGHGPAAPKPALSIGLFWRTFLFLGALLLGCIVAWFQTFRALEVEPRALQGAQQIASLVNLTRAALVHADPIARVSLVKTLVEQENVRIAVREPSDTFGLYDQDALSRRISAAVASRLGSDTIVAREVNGFPGLWIGFNIGSDTFWLLADPDRVGAIGETTWLVWLAIAAGLSLLGAALMARLINHPLKRLSDATAKVRDGHFQGERLNERLATREIREVNIGFNRMADQLGQAEADRTLMLAGISHDLRTPLARLRLETEMSVPDDTARELMVGDIEQVDAIIDKFLDYARTSAAQVQAVSLCDTVHACLAQWLNQEGVAAQVEVPDTAWVLADPVELRRVLSNLLENAQRYGRGADGQVKVSMGTQHQGKRIALTLRDHGPGVSEAVLPRLTEPFFRADQARTSASGSGLGLAIVKKTLSRMGGELALANHPQGGLVATVSLPAA
jgi:two-component system, OmpR family, osmolarity sensor histidine kinase EnvZ